jgi:hypothetical protein
MAGTATIDEALVSQPDTSVLFMARRRELRLVKTPRYPIYGPAGAKVGENPGQALQFTDGAFRCPREGTVTLEDGRPADAAEILEWLESHRMLNSLEEGFWRVDPTAPPVSQEEMRALMQAAMRLDVDTLEAIVEQERSGWGRSAIIDEAEQAIVEIRAALDAQGAEPEAPAENPKAKAKAE